MQPLYEPSLCGPRAAIRQVFVGGRQIMRDGKVLTFDYYASARLQMPQRRAIQKVPCLD